MDTTGSLRAVRRGMAAIKSGEASVCRQRDNGTPRGTPVPSASGRGRLCRAASREPPLPDGRQYSIAAQSPARETARFYGLLSPKTPRRFWLLFTREPDTGVSRPPPGLSRPVGAGTTTQDAVLARRTEAGVTPAKNGHRCVGALCTFPAVCAALSHFITGHWIGGRRRKPDETRTVPARRSAFSELMLNRLPSTGPFRWRGQRHTTPAEGARGSLGRAQVVLPLAEPAARVTSSKEFVPERRRNARDGKRVPKIAFTSASRCPFKSRTMDRSKV